jgi:hypothetical protein
MILIPTTGDVRLMLEDADQPIGEVVTATVLADTDEIEVAP